MIIPNFPPLLDVEMSIGSDGMPFWHRAREWSALLPTLENQKIKAIGRNACRSFKKITQRKTNNQINSNQIFKIVDFSRFQDLGNAQFPKGEYSIFQEIVSLLLAEDHQFKIIGGSKDYPIIAARWVEIRIIKDIVVTCVKYMRAKKYANNKIMISKIGKERRSLMMHAKKLIESIQDFEDEWFDILFDSCSIKFNELGSPALDYMSWRIGSFNAWLDEDSSHAKALCEKALTNLIDRFEKAGTFLDRINMEANGTAFTKLIGDVDLMLMSRSFMMFEKYASGNRRDRRYSTIRIFDLLKCFSKGEVPQSIKNVIDKNEFISTHSDTYDSVRAWRKLVSQAEVKWREAVEASLENPDCEERLEKARSTTRDLEFLFRGPGPAKAAKLI